MKTDVLFVTLPLPLISYVNQKDLYLGYRYMVSLLRSRGYGAEILYPEVPREFPAGAYFCTDARVSMRRLSLELVECISEQIAKIECKVLGFSPTISDFKFVIKLIQKLRIGGLDSHVVLGGHLATFSHKRLLSNYDCIDSVARGEGEYTIVDLTERIRNRKTLDGVLGLSYRDGKRIVINPPSPLVDDLDELPLPATDHIGRLLEGAGDYPFWMRICCSRGCYANCSFCSVRAFYGLSPGRKWRARTPARVVDEVEMLKRDFGIDHVVLGSDSFWCGTGKEMVKYANEIAREITSRKIDIQFKINSRSNDVNESTLGILRRAGLTDVEIGIESSSQRSLNTFKKGTTVEQNEEALRVLQRLGVRIHIDFIFYDPYITLHEVRRNYEFQKRYRSEKVEFPLFTKLIPAEGFYITDVLREEGLLRGRFPLYEFRFIDPVVGALESIHRKTWLRGHHLLSTLPPVLASFYYGMVPEDKRSRRLKPFLSALKGRFEFLKLHHFDNMLSIVEDADECDVRVVESLLEQEVKLWEREIEETKKSLKRIYQHLKGTSRVGAG